MGPVITVDAAAQGYIRLAALASHISGCASACIFSTTGSRLILKGASGLSTGVESKLSEGFDWDENKYSDEELAALSIPPFYDALKAAGFSRAYHLKHSKGHSLGLLCIFDPEEKKLSDPQQQALQLLCEEIAARFTGEAKTANPGTKRLLERRFASLSYYYKAMLNGTDYLVVVSDLNGIIRTFNTGAANMLRCQPDEVVDRDTILAFHNKEELPSLIGVEKAESITAKDYFARFNIGPSRISICTLTRRDGTTIKVQLSTSGIRNENKELIGYISIGEDITEKLKIEHALRESEEKHRIFFDNSQGLMLSHDMKGNLLSINEAGASIIGYHPLELEGKNLGYMLPAGMQQRLESYLQEISDVGTASGLMWVKHKEGGRKVLFFRNVKVGQGEGAYVIGNAIDVSSRVELENNLRRAKVLAEKMNSVKDQFLANMSHEIRTPMNAIIGFTDLLLQTPLDEDQKDSVRSIKTAGESLLGIINDILDFSKIESGNLFLDSAPFDLKELVQSTCNLLKVKAEDKGILLKTEIDRAIPAAIIGDKLRISQVILNLAGNAVKFTEEGEVCVTLKLLEESEKHCTVYFSIQDTGIGIPKEKIDSIFDRFTQASTETTRKYGGTGLGLSISRSLVILHGGRLGVKSETGKGSDFYFTLTFPKAAKPEGGGLKEKSPVAPAHKKLNVLLVEDNILNQKLARKVVEGFGFKISIAANGRIGVEMMKNESYDIVLMDLQMPEMDGYQATAEMRKTLGSQVPIMAMTAHSLVGEKEKCLQLGMNDYIAKPFDAKELYKKIIRLTGLRTDLEAVLAEEPAEQKSQPQVSLDRLIDLSGGDKEFEKEMIIAFIQSVPKDCQLISEALNAGDYNAVKRGCHKLKSSALLFNAEKAGSLLSEIENWRDDENLIKPAWHKATAMLDNAVAELKETMEKNY